jgi:glycosyltransferase involved in cell wall biosynthesis
VSAESEKKLYSSIMQKKLNYITRYRLPHYNSIEELFSTINTQVKQHYTTNWLELPKSGASPFSLFVNLRAIRPRKNNIYHITGDVNYMALRLGSQCILTVHDIQSALNGSPFKRWLIQLLWFTWPAKRVRFITVISEFSRQELEKIIPNQAHKIRVIHNPVSPAFQPHPSVEFNIHCPTVLLMGTKSNKNLEGSIKALKDLQVQLLIIGPLSITQVNLLKESNLNYTHRQHLRFNEVMDCYKQADLLCFPSFYEGFGMPIIEAQAIGRPVVTSNHGAMAEIAGNAAELVDPNDTESIKTGILNIINNSAHRAQLIAAGYENVKRFSLNKTVEAYLDLYDNMN